jgi:hypothetical protein
MTLGIGQFYVASEDWCKKVYVQPAWLDEETARRVAMGEIPAVGAPAPTVFPNAVPVDPIPEQYAALDNTGQLPEPQNCPAQEEEDPVVIADLLAQIAAWQRAGTQAEAERSELKKQLNERDTQIVNNQRGLDKLTQEMELWLPEMQASAKFRVALLEFLGSGTTPAGQPTLDLDALAEKVAARLGTGRVVPAVPLEALKHRFQQEAVDRLVEQVQALDERPRQAILWLLSVGRPARHMEICRRLAFPEAGASFAKFGTGIKAAVAIGFLVLDPEGLRVTIWEKVAAELEPYGAAPEDIEATYQHLLAALAEGVQVKEILGLWKDG